MLRLPPTRSISPLDHRSPTIFVVGPHRSGTSAVTLSLSRLGVELGGPLLPPMDANPRGFGELRAAMELDDALLGARGSTWDDPRLLPLEAEESPAFQKLLPRVAQVFTKGLCEAPLRALKDPRLCRLFPIWLGVARELGYPTATLLVYRPPEEAVRSLMVREGCSAEKAWRIWAIDALGMLEAGAASERRAWVAYPELLEDPEGTLEAVGAALGFEWPRQPTEATRDLRELLSPSLRHHKADPGAADAPPIGEPYRPAAQLVASALESRVFPDAEEIAAARRALEACPPSAAVLDEHLTALGRRTGLRLYHLQRRVRAAQAPRNPSEPH